MQDRESAVLVKETWLVMELTYVMVSSMQVLLVTSPVLLMTIKWYSFTDAYFLFALLYHYRWRFGTVVTSLDTSTKLLYTRPCEYLDG